MSSSTLTLALLAAEPELASTNVTLPNGEVLLFRPLSPSDVDRLTQFLESLSARTRHLWEQSGFDRDAAQAICDAIARYDKLRMVALAGPEPGAIVAVFEYSLDLVSEPERFASYGITLIAPLTCRFAPCVRDDWQHRGVGSALMPRMLEIATRFGKRCLVLWGGVLCENDPAIGFYTRSGFRMAGRFNQDGYDCYDMWLDIEGGTDRE